MTIELHKVTRLSMIAAVVLYVGTFALAFYFGQQYAYLQSGAYVTAAPDIQRDTTKDILATTSDISLGVGKTGKFGTFTVTLNSVAQDSRCPVDVQCVWAGTVNTSVTFEEGAQRETNNMSSDQDPQKFGDYRIGIRDVAPDRKSGVEIPGKKYVVTFRVTKQ